jgi:DNA-binding response OmpR family regulator
MATSSPYGSLRGTPALARGAGQHVLVVTREPGLAELLSTTLELAGCRVALADSGTEALTRVERHRFDLVVLDGELPDVARLDARRTAALAHRPPALVLTVCDSLPGLLPELGPGERDYVTKPFRMAEVLARIHVLLRAAVPGPCRADGLGYGDLILDDARCRARREALIHTRRGFGYWLGRADAEP